MGLNYGDGVYYNIYPDASLLGLQNFTLRYNSIVTGSELVAFIDAPFSMAIGKDVVISASVTNFGTLDEIDVNIFIYIDEILVEAIYEGAKMSLEDGLELEARLFGECINTEDMKIGIENFMKNGPRTKAEFVHR